MKIVLSPRYSTSRQRAFTLAEVMIAMAVTAMMMITLLMVLGRFYGGSFLAQIIAVNQKYQIESIAVELRRYITAGGNAFVFEGRLFNADGSPYAGAPLPDSVQAFSLTDGTALLAAAGMSTAVVPGSDCATILCLQDPRAPLWFERETRQRGDGSHAITIRIVGNRRARDLTFVLGPRASAAQLLAAQGGVSVDVDGHGIVELPNPLAAPDAETPNIRGGSRLHLPHLVFRQAP